MMGIHDDEVEFYTVRLRGWPRRMEVIGSWKSGPKAGRRDWNGVVHRAGLGGSPEGLVEGAVPLTSALQIRLGKFATDLYLNRLPLGARLVST